MEEAPLKCWTNCITSDPAKASSVAIRGAGSRGPGPGAQPPRPSPLLASGTMKLLNWAEFLQVKCRRLGFRLRYRMPRLIILSKATVATNMHSKKGFGLNRFQTFDTTSLR